MGLRRINVLSSNNLIQIEHDFLSFKKKIQEAGEIVHWLRVLAALTQGQNSVASTHIRRPHLPITPVPWALRPLPGSIVFACMWCTQYIPAIINIKFERFI